MIIEFIGTPGSGKTSLLHTAVESLREAGMRPFTVVEASRVFAARTTVGKVVQVIAPASIRQQMLWQVFHSLSSLKRVRFKQEHHQLFTLIARWQSDRPEDAGAQQRRVEYWLNQLAGYYSFLSANTQAGEVLLFDEGFVHRVVQLFASPVETPDAAKVAAYAALIPQPDLVVYVNAPVEVCLKRIHERGVWQRMQNKSPEELHHFLENADLAVTQMVARLIAQNWQVIEVDNSQSDISTAQQSLSMQLTQTLYPNLSETLPVLEFQRVQST